MIVRTSSKVCAFITQSCIENKGIRMLAHRPTKPGKDIVIISSGELGFKRARHEVFCVRSPSVWTNAFPCVVRCTQLLS